MESLLSLLRMHWDQEPGRAQRRAGVPPARRARQRQRFSSVGVADGGRRDACPTFRFMESLCSLWRVHGDHELELAQPTGRLPAWYVFGSQFPMRQERGLSTLRSSTATEDGQAASPSALADRKGIWQGPLSHAEAA